MIRVRIDPTNIVFGWNASLRVVKRGGPMRVSQWIRQSDGMDFAVSNKERELRVRDSGFVGSNLKDYPNQRDLNLNRDITANITRRDLFLVGSNDSKVLSSSLTGSGSNGERSLIHQDEGKKGQRTIRESDGWKVLMTYRLALLGKAVGNYENLKLECPQIGES